MLGDLSGIAVSDPSRERRGEAENREPTDPEAFGTSSSLKYFERAAPDGDIRALPYDRISESDEFYKRCVIFQVLCYPVTMVVGIVGYSILVWTQGFFPKWRREWQRSPCECFIARFLCAGCGWVYVWVVPIFAAYATLYVAGDFLYVLSGATSCRHAIKNHVEYRSVIPYPPRVLTYQVIIYCTKCMNDECRRFACWFGWAIIGGDPTWPMFQRAVRDGDAIVADEILRLAPKLTPYLAVEKPEESKSPGSYDYYWGKDKNALTPQLATASTFDDLLNMVNEMIEDQLRNSKPNITRRKNSWGTTVLTVPAVPVSMDAVSKSSHGSGTAIAEAVAKDGIKVVGTQNV